MEEQDESAFSCGGEKKDEGLRLLRAEQLSAPQRGRETRVCVTVVDKIKKSLHSLALHSFNFSFYSYSPNLQDQSTAADV